MWDIYWGIQTHCRMLWNLRAYLPDILPKGCFSFQTNKLKLFAALKMEQMKMHTAPYSPNIIWEQLWALLRRSGVRGDTLLPKAPLALDLQIKSLPAVICLWDANFYFGGSAQFLSMFPSWPGMGPESGGRGVVVYVYSCKERAANEHLILGILYSMATL